MNKLLLVFCFSLFTSIAFAQPALYFAESGGYGNTYAYEVGSLRAPMASYSINHSYADGSLYLMSMTFQQIGTYDGPDLNLEIGNETYGASKYMGQIISSSQLRTGENYTVRLKGKRFGYLMDQNNYDFVLSADIHATKYRGGTIGFRLIGYRVMDLDGNVYDHSVVPSGILPFNIVRKGSNGFAPLPADTFVTLNAGGESVSAFALQSVSADSFSLMGYPTYFGPGLNTNMSSGGMNVGSAMKISYSANANVPAGIYSGAQVVQDGNSDLRIARTSRVTVTVAE